jgi:hypothetical protein
VLPQGWSAIINDSSQECLLDIVEFRPIVEEKRSVLTVVGKEVVIVLELNSAEVTDEAMGSGVDDKTICDVAPIACTDSPGAAVAVEVNGYAGTDGRATEVTCGTAGTVRSLGNGGTAGTVGKDGTVWTAIVLPF